MSDLRCPRCGAARRPGDQWCGLCYADFREPAPQVVGDTTPPAAAPAAAPAAPVPPPDGLTPPLIRPPEAAGVTLPPTQPAAPTPAPTPVAAIPVQQVASAAPPAAAPFAPSTNPLAASPQAAGLAPTVAPTATPAADAAGAPADPEAPYDPAAAAKWPCPRCGEEVPIAEDHCPVCGAAFLEPVRADKAIRVPGFGDVSKMSTGQKVMFGAAIAVSLTLILVVLATIGGAIFH
ncbi:MAG TPA: hypothetical protein VG650_12900 [Mycobacteriales bacterium]|nr:hypothetical protein [Mycobacteriales bacterium]